MKILLLLISIAALLYTADVTPEQTQKESWQPWVLGAPGSTKTDIEEGTCIVQVKRKPDWRKK